MSRRIALAHLNFTWAYRSNKLPTEKRNLNMILVAQTMCMKRLKMSSVVCRILISPSTSRPIILLSPSATSNTNLN